MSDLVIPNNFILAARDAGYRGLTFALAELVDNAIDAGASRIEVRIDEDRLDGDRAITISVLDNGTGMTKRTLSEALRFGGSERFNLRTSLGRYGMGLPNSSVSQAPRVDVYTWRRGQPPLRAHLDVDDISRRRTFGVPEPQRCKLPGWVVRPGASGTLVQWSRCDRLRFKKASTLARKLSPELGRIYRIPLSTGLTIRVNGEALSPVDPLFRTPVDGLEGTCQPYGEPLVYRIKRPGGGVSLVTVRFVELPVARWYGLSTETKRSVGIVGGAGLSVLRARREIDHGWHFFGTKRRENYDDWWRAELSFDPHLDELVGITHSKQGINPGPELLEILAPDLERIARTLNGRVRKAFDRLRPKASDDASRRAAARDRLLPSVRAGDPSVRRRAGEGYRFQIAPSEDVSPEFFKAEIEGSLVRLCINKNHPFYRRLYVQSLDVDRLELLLLAAARALFDVPEEARRTFVRSWSDNLLAYLAE